MSEVATDHPVSLGTVFSRLWPWLVVTALAVVQWAKFSTVLSFIRSQANDAPDAGDMAPEIYDAALRVGTSLGLVIACIIGSLLILMTRDVLARATSPQPRSASQVLPTWGSGVLAVGLLVPDLCSATTGHILPLDQPLFWAVYVPSVAVAVVLAPSPKHRGLRAVDLLMALLLPLV